MDYQVFLAGVGGQGILSVTDILCNAAVEMGFTIRGSETHGMSQRGGSVFSNVRFGDVHSPLIMERTANILMGFEPSEALRYAKFVDSNGLDSILSALKKYSKQIVSLNATQLASELGKPIVQNIIMLGVLSAVPELPLTDIAIKTALKRQFKEDFFDLNLKAYEIGRDSFNKSQ
ncbi:MAG: indolepyruvate oxidoreductase subunit beta [Candidatus Hodarchaeales archaeon]|jgi:indolepyruvate ferredoxin oxidoreductase beta subunit